MKRFEVRVHLYGPVAERPTGEELWVLHVRSTPSEVLERALAPR